MWVILDVGDEGRGGRLQKQRPSSQRGRGGALQWPEK